MNRLGYFWTFASFKLGVGGWGTLKFRGQIRVVLLSVFFLKNIYVPVLLHFIVFLFLIHEIYFLQVQELNFWTRSLSTKEEMHLTCDV